MFLSGMVGTASGGTEKKYHILNQNMLVWSNSEYAEAGQIVGMGTNEKYDIGAGESFVKTASGTMIPMLEGKVQGITFPNGRSNYYFVMPAEDVVVSG